MTVDASEISATTTAFQLVICSRVTVQDFSPEPLPAGALFRALEAGLSAPNHRLTEPWRFIRVGHQTRQCLAQVQARLKDKGRTPSAESLNRAREKLGIAPELIVLLRAVSADAVVGREDYAAIACAVQNIALCLWAEGVGSKWSTGGVTSDAETYSLLGLDPATTEIVGFLTIGRPRGESPKKPPRRLGLAEVLTELP